MMENKIVSIVDADIGSSRAVGELLGAMGLGWAAFGSAGEFFDAFDPLQPGCVILEVRIPGTNGLEVQRELARRQAPQPVVFLTAHGAVSIAVRSMQAGAVHFLEKPFRESELWGAVVESLELDERRRSALVTQKKLRQRITQLSEEERQLAQRIVSGESNRQMAQEGGVSVRTIECRRSRIMKKLQVQGVAQLAQVYWAMEMDDNHLDATETRLGWPMYRPPVAG